MKILKRINKWVNTSKYLKEDGTVSIAYYELHERECMSKAMLVTVGPLMIVVFVVLGVLLK